MSRVLQNLDTHASASRHGARLRAPRSALVPAATPGMCALACAAKAGRAQALTGAWVTYAGTAVYMAPGLRPALWVPVCTRRVSWSHRE